MLYRVFPHRPEAAAVEAGGALHVARVRQGAGRHDSPQLYGALYASATATSAVAERIQAFRGHALSDDDFVTASGWRLALAELDDTALGGLVDLDEPRALLARRLRPSRVATRQRAVTQQIARDLFTEGTPGFRWWSTLEASWPNATLFAERAVPLLAVADPEPLSTRLDIVREAADALGIRLAI